MLCLLQLVKIRLKVDRVSGAGGALPAFLTRSIASSHSSFVKNQDLVVYGVSGNTKKVTKPIGTVMHCLSVRKRLRVETLTYTTDDIQPTPARKAMRAV